MRYVWDEPKRFSNLQKHGLDFADVENGFFEWDGALVRPSYPGKRGEARFSATGFMHDNLVALAFSPLGSEALSLISLRPASRKERRLYAER